MAVQIKIPNIPSSVQQVTLDNTTYTIKSYFNVRDEGWRLDISDIDGNIILAGAKIMPVANLTGKYILDAFPNGNLWVLPTTSGTTAVGFDNFGTGKNYQLWYLTLEEEVENGLDVL